MKCYLVLDLKIIDLPSFMSYVKNIPKFLNKHGGKYIVEGVEPELVEGDWRPERLVIIEFPSKADAENFLSDPEVQPWFEIRRKATNSKLIMAVGTSWKDEKARV